MMRFENLKPEELELRNVTSELLHFRRNSMPLLYGEIQVIKFDENIFIAERNYFGKLVYVIFNNSNKSANISFETVKTNSAETFKVLSKSKIEKKGNSISVNLGADSFEIIYN